MTTYKAAARPFPERLFAKVRGPWLDPTVEEANCWQWVGGWRSRYGYGRLRMGRRGDGSGQAHRLMYSIVRGPVPPGLVLRHVVCGDPGCCNPRHMEAGSVADNYADQLADGWPPLWQRGRAV